MYNYAQMYLNRASKERKSQDWCQRQMMQNSRWVLTYQDKNLFKVDDAEPVFLTKEQLGRLDVSQAIFLGNNAEHAYFAIDVSHLEEPAIKALHYFGEFVDLRRHGVAIFGEQASILALARGLSYWHRTHRFCGRCGHQNHMVEAGHSRKCTNANCLHQTFPRTDPAVIMLVTHVFADGIERCLLGRQSVWPNGAMSTLAGFVDPGETLEQAVAREVMEEAGIKVTDIGYLASQPWPFPSSIMLGFIARAEEPKITVDEDEIEQAHWFSRAELNEFGQWGDDSQGYKLPRIDSISRYLIEHWRNLASPETV